MERLRADDDRLPSTISALNQLALHMPYVFELSRDVVSAFIVKNVLLSAPEEDNESEEDVDWVDYKDLSPFVQSKVLGVKLLINRIIPLAKEGDESYRDGAKSVFKLLWKILDMDGELLANGTSNAVCRAHLRNTAARGLLKLAKADRAFDDMITPLDFQKLALVIQDSCYQVRESFANRLIKYIQLGGLSTRYSIILMLSAHEPEAELKHRVGSRCVGFFLVSELRAYLQIKLHLIRRAKALRSEHEKDPAIDLLELSYVRLIHVLAHHPDFGTDLESLQLFAKYIDFFLETIATSENISYLYMVSGQLKVVRDVLSEDSNVGAIVSHSSNCA